MFQIDTARPRWRRVAVAGLALPLSLALSGTASANESEADLKLSVSCFGISVTSDKDISNVKVSFTDGTSVEIPLSGFSFDRTFEKTVATASAKSGTSERTATPRGCAPAPAGEAEDVEAAEEPEPAIVPTEPVRGESPALPATGNGTAVVTLTVDCDDVVRVTSDKDISNVKVTFTDGTTEEIEGLSGLTFERDFSQEITSATAKSATTEVSATFADCDVVDGGSPPAKQDETPAVVVGTPVQDDESPTTSTTPITGRPAPQAAAGGEGVVAEETPDQVVVPVPVSGLPATQPALAGPVVAPAPAPAPAAGAVAAPVAVAVAQFPAGVAAEGAVSPQVLPVVQPAVLAQAGPAQLPFTGTTAETLLPLGGLLLLAGGGVMIAGRRSYVPRHAAAAASRRA